jgi:caffeoyl-CoA O-methyltransferase
MVKAEKALELGTFIGYSSICIAEGLQENGLLTTCDHNEEAIARAKEFVSRSSVRDRIQFRCQKVENLITELLKTRLKSNTSMSTSKL